MQKQGLETIMQERQRNKASNNAGRINIPINIKKTMQERPDQKKHRGEASENHAESWAYAAGAKTPCSEWEWDEDQQQRAKMRWVHDSSGW